MKKFYYIKIFELIIITFFIPSLIILFNLQKLIILIVIFAAIISFIYLRKKNYKFDSFFDIKNKDIKKIFLKILLICTILFFITCFLLPETFIIFPYLDLKLWILVMIFYPIFSALPQELFFRAFFFHRYSIIFKNKNFLIIINALIFGIMHSVYLNFIVVILAFCGGIIFAKNYCCNKSIFLVTIEHALIGNFMFSIGLGYYFFQSNIKYIYSLI